MPLLAQLLDILDEVMLVSNVYIDTTCRYCGTELPNAWSDNDARYYPHDATCPVTQLRTLRGTTRLDA